MTRDISMYANADAFRSAMGRFATGVTVITTSFEEHHYGMTVNSLTSVSLDPCLLLICPRRGSSTGNAIARRKAFAVNILSSDQHKISQRFVNRITDRFSGLDLEIDEYGLPSLSHCIASFSCSVYAIHAAGDHDIIVGNVLKCTTGDGDPLLFYRGSVGRHCLQELI